MHRCSTDPGTVSLSCAVMNVNVKPCKIRALRLVSTSKFFQAQEPHSALNASPKGRDAEVRRAISGI